MRSIRRLLAAGVAAVLVLTACGSPQQDRPRVVTTFYAAQWAAEQVLGGKGSVVNLTQPGAEAHDLELTPQQIASLGDADLVVYLKGFQPAVDKAVENSGAKHVLDLATVLPLRPIPGNTHSHDEHASEKPADDGQDHGAIDPHFWQDPELMGQAVSAISKALTEQGQAGPIPLSPNVDTSLAELKKLQEEYNAGLAKCERREFITTHAAFQYLAHRYSLTEIGISGINPDAEPSPARIAQVHDEAKRHGVTTIFFETLTSDAVARSIAGDLGLKTAVLDPLEGLTDKSPGTDYPSIMRGNLNNLRQANGCS